jgi:hypothetical protein
VFLFASKLLGGLSRCLRPRRIFSSIDKTYLRTIANRAAFYVLIDIPSDGEIQFVEPVIMILSKKNRIKILLIYNQSIPTCNEVLLSAKYSLPLVHRSSIEIADKKRLKIFITPEQYNKGISGIYSICMFHGQPGKGLSYVPDVIETFDALFLASPIHLEAYYHYLDDFFPMQGNRKVALYMIGYPKIDSIMAEGFPMNPDIRGKDTIRVLYAPSFNEGGSLREFGTKVIETLCSIPNIEVMAKLPIDCWQPTTNWYATGGIDWHKRLKILQKTFSNFRLHYRYNINDLLQHSDILVTCLSTVGYDFMCLSKPVIYIDSPSYYGNSLAKRLPGINIDDWNQRDSVNGGRNYGYTVYSLGEIPGAIKYIKDNCDLFPRNKDQLHSKLLYNPGKGAEASAIQISSLLAQLCS